LFVIMLLGPSATSARDTRGSVTRAASAKRIALAMSGAGWLVIRAGLAAQRHMPMPQLDATGNFGGIDAFGAVLFSDGLVPFELSSALLMVAVIGAVAVARGRQGHKGLTLSERRAAAQAGPEAPHTDVGGRQS
jgi:NADH-quinone oxidoreductase subunit J